MKTKDGVLYLTKKEREALQTIHRHTMADLSYGWGGSYGGHDEDSKVECSRAEVEVKKAELGLDVLEFVLRVTE